MSKPLLLVRDLQVTVEDKVVLNNFNCELFEKEMVFLTGRNGGGKSSLANVLMGNKDYKVMSGRIEFEGKNLLELSSDERAKAGLFVGWQNPVTIPGVSVFNLCKSSYEALRQAQGKPFEYESLTEFKKKLEEIAVKLGLTSNHVMRNINEGFSGGEKKRLELVQMLLLEPKLAILDEIDSGLDFEGINTVVGVLHELRKKQISLIMITHNKKLPEEFRADHIWEINNGRLSTRV